MELIVLIPVVLLMGVVAVVMAVKEQPLPVGASTAFTPIPVRPSSKVVAMHKPAAKDEAIDKIILPGGSPEIESPAEETDDMTGQQFTSTDVLLADALTEMIGLKAELFHLRSKLESLNTEVARLSGGPPRRPPAASKEPIPLRKAA
jgi:hypothetical protein